MSKLRLTLLVTLLVLAGAGAAAEQPPTPAQRAELLRELRDQIGASRPAAAAELYQRYFEAFPTSFAEVSEVLVSDQYRELLLRPDEHWDFGQAYVVLMCESYDRLDHRRYMKKMLHLGISGNDWGGLGKDRQENLYPGDIYQRLIFRYACAQRTEAAAREQLSVIYELLPEFTDAQLEAIYNSLSWAEDRKWPLDWFLEGICSRYPGRCPLTRVLREKYRQDSAGPHSQ